MDAPTLTVVVLNYNGREDTLDCLQSLHTAGYPSLHVVAVDNNSSDGSMDAFRDWAHTSGVPIVDDLDARTDEVEPSKGFEPGALTLIQTGENLGFSAGNNHGIRYALGTSTDHVMILNNDCLVQEGALDRLVRTLEERADAGLVFPKIVDEDGEIQVPVYLRPAETLTGLLIRSNYGALVSNRYARKAYLERTNPLPGYAYEEPVAVPNVVVAVTVFRRGFFEELGLFDEAMFMYYEEYVLKKKMEDSRFSSILEPRATIVHKGGKGNEQLDNAWLHKKRLQSELHYLREYSDLGPMRRAGLKGIRTVEFLVQAVSDDDYRSELGSFLRTYVLA